MGPTPIGVRVAVVGVGPRVVGAAAAGVFVVGVVVGGEVGVDGLFEVGVAVWDAVAVGVDAAGKAAAGGLG